MTKIQITLSAANMGPNATEADFNDWADYVASNIDETLDIKSEVDQFAFGSANEDTVSNGEPDQIEAVKHWLSNEGWEAFCSEGGVPEMHADGMP